MKFSMPAFLLTAFFLLIPAAAQAATAYATDNLHLRAGPDGDYPSVGVIRSGEKVELLGCVSGRQWCEVETRDGEYGWVAAYYLRTTYQGRSYSVIESNPYGGVRVIIYSPHDYWDNHYRNKYFYKDRDKWLGKPVRGHDWNNDDDYNHGHHGRPDKPRPEPVKEEPKYKKMDVPQSRGKYNPLCKMGQNDC